jgi:hypothetical protein
MFSRCHSYCHALSASFMLILIHAAELCDREVSIRRRHYPTDGLFSRRDGFMHLKRCAICQKVHDEWFIESRGEREELEVPNFLWGTIGRIRKSATSEDKSNCSTRRLKKLVHTLFGLKKSQATNPAFNPENQNARSCNELETEHDVLAKKTWSTWKPNYTRLQVGPSPTCIL